MHIPDGYLSLPWVVLTYAITIAFGVVAVYKARKVWGPATATAVTLAAAAIFVAQMLNWPIPVSNGTSLHLVGGALVAMILGPWLAFIAMSIVLVTQAIVFHDGGITTLGANILNMGIVDVLVGYAVFKLVTRLVPGRKGRLLGAFLGGWLGIAVAGTVAGIEIGLSPQFPYGVEITVPVMAFWHTLLGIVEGIITALVVDYVYTHSPSLVMVRVVRSEVVGR